MLSGRQLPLLLESAVTNAFFVSLHGLSVGPFPPRPCPFRFAKLALVTSGNRLAALAAGFRLRLGSDVALRLRFAKRFSPLSAPLPRSPTADRSLIKIEENFSSDAQETQTMI